MYYLFIYNTYNLSSAARVDVSEIKRCNGNN